jgi:hypothetical protein
MGTTRPCFSGAPSSSGASTGTKRHSPRTSKPSCSRRPPRWRAGRPGRASARSLVCGGARSGSRPHDRRPVGRTQPRFARGRAGRRPPAPRLAHRGSRYARCGNPARWRADLAGARSARRRGSRGPRGARSRLRPGHSSRVLRPLGARPSASQARTSVFERARRRRTSSPSSPNAAKRARQRRATIGARRRTPRDRTSRSAPGLR